MFHIDFFELCFLAEVCVPPRPIARTMFWHKLINKHYHSMTDKERSALFDWIRNNPSFNMGNEDCRWFYLRFNPDNQYRVLTEINGKKEEHLAFAKEVNGEITYFTAMDTSINEDYIYDSLQITADT